MSDANHWGPDPSQKAVIEQLQRRTARVRAAERSELVGLLAGAISHDLNNALGVIVTYSSLLMSSTPEGTEAREDLNAIFTAARRAGELSRWLNLFSGELDSGPDSGVGRHHSLADSARRIEKIATRFLTGSGLKSEFALEESGAPVAMPSRHVEDALFGLLAEVASCLQEGSVVLTVCTEPAADVSRARIRASGAVQTAPPAGELSLLAPGPFDTGTPQALRSLNQLAEGYGGRVGRRELEDGFELELEVPLHHDESDEEKQA